MPIEISGRPMPPDAGAVGQGGKLRAAQGEAPQRPDNVTPHASRDSVSLTGAAGLLQRLDAEIAALPVIDAGRVAELRQAISEGGLPSDAGRVADRLVRHELALFGRG